MVRAGLAADRFVPLGQVSSVWETLKALDAACYIGSAPVGGGRAAIEAQGCGYPMVFFEGHEEDSLLANFDLYACRELGWSTFEELGDKLRAVGAGHEELSAQARRHYEEGYARPVFKRVLDSVLAS